MSTVPLLASRGDLGCESFGSPRNRVSDSELLYSLGVVPIPYLEVDMLSRSQTSIVLKNNQMIQAEQVLDGYLSFIPEERCFLPPKTVKL